MPDFDFEIPLRTQPLRVKVGEQIYEFQPELDSEQMLGAHEKLLAIRAEVRIDEDGTPDADAIRRMAQATREYVARLMLPGSAQKFLASPPPDRVVMEMSRWVMEQHGGGRPTTPSIGSSDSSPRTGNRSTGLSPSRGSTGGGGARRR